MAMCVRRLGTAPVSSLRGKRLPAARTLHHELFRTGPNLGLTRTGFKDNLTVPGTHALAHGLPRAGIERQDYNGW